jgi:hypothetical protein
MNHLDRVLPYAPNAVDFRKLLLSYRECIDYDKSEYYKFSIFPGGPAAQVFYDIDYLRKHWGRMLNIISITPEAYGYQTAIVMEKSDEVIE